MNEKSINLENCFFIYQTFDFNVQWQQNVKKIGMYIKRTIIDDKQVTTYKHKLHCSADAFKAKVYSFNYNTTNR